MKTIYYTASSLDGFIADSSDSLDWLLPFGSVATDYSNFVTTVGAAAMGARTWRWLWERHLSKDAPEPIPWPYAFPVWVFTHGSQQQLPGAELRWVEGDVAAVHSAMVRAANGKNIWMIGGGELAAQFADANLLDEMWITYAPVTLGAGRPLLPGARGNRPLRLLESHTFGNTLVQMRFSWRPVADPSGDDKPKA